jgi:hypothetical protein
MSFGINHNSSSQDTSQVASNLYNQGGTSSGTTARTLTPEQLQAQTQITQLIHALATNPGQFLAPAQNDARNQVNDNYAGVSDSLRQQFLANPSGGSSGKYGTVATQADLARRGDLSKVDTTFATEKSQLPFTAAGLSQQLLNMNMGQTTTGTTSNTGTSSSTATGHEEGSGTGVNAGVKLFGLG